MSPHKHRRTRAQRHTNTLAAFLTLNTGEYDPGVIVGNDVSVAVLWFVDLQVGVLPCELLTGVDGLQGQRTKSKHQQKIRESTTFKRLYVRCNSLITSGIRYKHYHSNLSAGKDVVLS